MFFTFWPYSLRDVTSRLKFATKYRMEDRERMSNEREWEENGTFQDRHLDDPCLYQINGDEGGYS